MMTEEESLLAAIHEEVKLHAYQASWAQAFDLERDRLLSLFPGSTAVPGLSAKPIIDMLAGAQSIATAERLALPLCQSGYTTSSEFNDSLSDRSGSCAGRTGTGPITFILSSMTVVSGTDDTDAKTDLIRTVLHDT